MLTKLRKLLKRIISTIKELGVERDIYLSDIFDRRARPSLIPQYTGLSGSQTGNGVLRIPLRVARKRREGEVEFDYNIQIRIYEDFCTIYNYCTRTDVWIPSGKQWKQISEARKHAEKTKELFESQGYRAKITEVDQRRRESRGTGRARSATPHDSCL